MNAFSVTDSLLGTAAVGALLLAGQSAKAEGIQTLRTEILALQERPGQLENRCAVAPAAAVESGAKPRSWKLLGTNTTTQIGGFAKMDLIYNINAFTDYWLSSQQPIRENLSILQKDTLLDSHLDPDRLGRACDPCRGRFLRCRRQPTGRELQFAPDTPHL